MSKTTPVYVPPQEAERQRHASQAFASLEGRPQTYHVVTYGCQMNAHDSEKLAGMLQGMGLRESPQREEADFVLFNTCCIRDNAERRALGNVNWLKEIKKQRPSMLIGVCGCMVQQSHMARKILKQYKFIDLAFGTHNMHELPSLLYQRVEQNSPVVSVLDQENLIAEDVPLRRLNAYHAYVTIMYGCDNFCSYCVVPYVRGRERSRRLSDILREVEGLQRDGVQEIMLLGQNVNSYQGGGPGESFPALLKALDGLGVPRIRFMTSHPKDLSDELIQVMAGSRHICNHLHLPVQSGNDEVLRAMNRGYTREGYLNRVRLLREAMPHIGLTTDFIVGFPGETEAQFEDSLSLVREVGYDAAFSFVFSPRQGTRAALLPGQVEAEVTSRRMERLLEALATSTAQVHQGMIGRREEVLVESISKRSPGQVSGKGTRSITVTLDGTREDIGRVVPVTIASAAVNTLRGERIKGE